jgi:hypothetical protein
VRKAMVGANSILSWSPLPKRGSECGGRTNPQGTGSQATPLTPHNSRQTPLTATNLAKYLVNRPRFPHPRSRRNWPSHPATARRLPALSRRAPATREGRRFSACSASLFPCKRARAAGARSRAASPSVLTAAQSWQRVRPRESGGRP